MVTSSPDVLRDEAQRLHYLPGPNIDSSDDGGDHGDWWCWTTARCRWKLRRLQLRLGRASLDYGEPITQAIPANGERRRRGHGDGGGGGAPASSRTVLALTKGYQWAWEEAVRCWGGGGAMAVAMGWLGASLCTVMATAELQELGGSCWRCDEEEGRGK